MPTIVLGSQSQIKLEACRIAFPTHKVVSIDASSNVPEQPVGKDQTKLGATNRAIAASKAALSGSIVDNSILSIGIENGMWCPFNPYDQSQNSTTSLKHGTWVDGACCVAVHIDPKTGIKTTRVAWSDTINIPIGATPGENGEWSILKDPHLTITNISRKTYLSNALTELAQKINNPNLLNQVNWGIIGCGAVCEIKSGPGLYKCNGSNLVAVCRRNGDLAQSFATRHNVPTAYNNVHDLLNDTNVNAIYIASPPGTHQEMALLALAANKPTYIEKPIGRNYKETNEIIQAFKKKNVPLYSAYYRRGQKRFLRAKAIVAEGRLGKVTSVEYSMIRGTYTMSKELPMPWRFKAESSGGGLIMDVGCHTIDALEFVLDCKITNVKGHASNLNSTYAVEDTVSLIGRMKHENGAINAHVNMNWNFCGPIGQRIDHIVIRGTKGELKMSTFGADPIVLETMVGTEENAMTKLIEEFQYELPEHAQMPLIQTIVDELRGVEDQPCASKGDVNVAVVIDEALNEYYGGRQDDFWNRPETWQKNTK